MFLILEKLTLLNRIYELNFVKINNAPQLIILK